MSIKAKLTRFKINGSYVPCELSCELTITQETQQITNNTNGRAKSFRRGYYEWSANVDTKFTVSSSQASSVALLKTVLDDGDGIIDVELITIGDDEAPFSIKGQAIITSSVLSAGNTGHFGNNIVLQGSGALEMDYDIWWRIINAMPAPSDKNKVVQTFNW